MCVCAGLRMAPRLAVCETLSHVTESENFVCALVCERHAGCTKIKYSLFTFIYHRGAYGPGRVASGYGHVSGLIL